MAQIVLAFFMRGTYFSRSALLRAKPPVAITTPSLASTFLTPAFDESRTPQMRFAFPS